MIRDSFGMSGLSVDRLVAQIGCVREGQGKGKGFNLGLMVNCSGFRERWIGGYFDLPVCECCCICTMVCVSVCVCVDIV